MKFITKLILAFLLCSTTLSAQNTTQFTELNLLPNFLITILSGVLLAFGFQFLLTALSVALGVTSTSNLKDKWVESKYGNDDDDDDDEDNNYDYNSGISTGVKITSALGLWNILTVAPALFAGTALALMLTPITDTMVNITLALVIWAAFFMLLFYLESRMLGTLIGGLINTAVAGLRSTKNSIQSLVMPSPQRQIQNIADSTIEKVRQEMSSTFDTDSIVNTLDKYFEQIQNKMPEYDTLRNDLKEIAAAASPNFQGSSFSISDNTNQAEEDKMAKWTAIQGIIQTAITTDTSKLTEQGKQRIKQLDNLLTEAKSFYNNTDFSTAGFQKAISSSIDQEKINGYTTKVQNFFQSATPEKMESGEMKKELDEILDDSSKTVKGLREKMNELDRDAITKSLEKNSSLDKSQISIYAAQAESALNQAKEKLSNVEFDFSTDDLVNRFKENVNNFINGASNLDLDYTYLKDNFSKAINNSSESLDIIKRRLSTFDRNTVTAAITNTGMVSSAYLDKVVQSVEDARNEVAKQIQSIEDTARKTVKNMERKAVIQAEHARKSAISAAWWLVATIVISGGAAIAAAFIAI